MATWKYNNKPMTHLKDFPEGTVGFVYMVEFSNGNKYVGKKQIISKTKLKPLKGYKRNRIVIKEAKWQNYFGSIKDEQFIEDFKAGRVKVVSKKILYLCKNKLELTYYEEKVQYASDCLFRDNYYNANIRGKIFAKYIEWKK